MGTTSNTEQPAFWGIARASLALFAMCAPGVTFAGCSEEPTEETKVHAELKPQPSVMVRLTKAQYTNAVRTLFGDGVTIPSQLEPDVAIDGLHAIGASITPVSDRGVELFEEAARTLAEEVAAKPEIRNAVFPCQPATHTDADATCADETLKKLGRMAWRRPLTTVELARLNKIANDGGKTLGDFHRGVGYAITALLQSPHFLYRPEPGKAFGDTVRYTSWEMASRLAFFLWNGPPDEVLLDAANTDSLIDDGALAAQVDRMLKHDNARRGVTAFFAQWLHLSELDDLTKDPNVFKHYSAELGAMAREETLRTAEHLVFEKDADLREFFTGRTTFVNRRLAAIYNLKAPVEEGFGKLELPESGLRRGFFGQVAFLAANAHPVSTSAVLRGVYLREVILCQTVPAPPSNLNTAIPQIDANAKTMRQRLTSHMQDPACAGCHKFTDIPGLGFEKFDGMGRFRTHELGEPIDDSGEIDGEKFSDFGDMVKLLAAGERVPKCFVEKLYAYASGRRIGAGERGEVARLIDQFNGSGRRVLALMRAVAMSDGFRTTATPKEGIN